MDLEIIILIKISHDRDIKFFAQTLVIKFQHFLAVVPANLAIKMQKTNCKKVRPPV